MSVEVGLERQPAVLRGSEAGKKEYRYSAKSARCRKTWTATRREDSRPGRRRARPRLHGEGPGGTRANVKGCSLLRFGASWLVRSGKRSMICSEKAARQDRDRWGYWASPEELNVIGLPREAPTGRYRWRTRSAPEWEESRTETAPGKARTRTSITQAPTVKPVSSSMSERVDRTDNPELSRPDTSMSADLVHDAPPNWVDRPPACAGVVRRRVAITNMATAAGSSCLHARIVPGAPPHTRLR